MSILAQILLFTFLSGILSLIGGAILLFNRHWVGKFSVHFVSFAAGALLATAFLDLLPDAFEEGTATAQMVLMSVLAGMLVFFLLERLIVKFHPHHHEDLGDLGEHHHPTPILMQVGDTVHNFIDGVAVAAAFLANAPLGVITALAVAAHELPQEISDFSIMLHHGYTRRTVLTLNLFSSFASIVGAYLAYVSRHFIEPILPQLLGLTAGIFIYISASDLIPEISEKNAPDKTSHVIVLLLLGIFSVGILRYYLEH